MDVLERGLRRELSGASRVEYYMIGSRMGKINGDIVPRRGPVGDSLLFTLHDALDCTS